MNETVVKKLGSGVQGTVDLVRTKNGNLVARKTFKNDQDFKIQNQIYHKINQQRINSMERRMSYFPKYYECNNDKKSIDIEYCDGFRTLQNIIQEQRLMWIFRRKYYNELNEKIIKNVS